MGLFGPKKKNPREQVREWSSKIRQETRQLDRSILNIKREEDKVKTSLKAAAKTKNREACLILAKELVNSRKAIKRLNRTKAQIKSVEFSIQQQAALVRISGVIERSTDIMTGMQKLMNLSEISETMRDMSKEMTKAGIMGEMMDDMMEDVLGGEEDLEDEANDEIDKLLYEITAGELGKAPSVVNDKLPIVEPPQAEEETEDIGDMQARLEALRS